MKLDKKYKAYLKVNIVSLFFIGISFISVTLAWFAYSGIAKVDTKVGVNAWYIEFDKDGVPTPGNVEIEVPDIHPGMDTVTKIVDIKNLGDIDAEVNYAVKSARVLDRADDNYVMSNEKPTELIEDKLSHKYPFSINMKLSKKYISKGDEVGGQFVVTVSWPLDSGDDDNDSLWGNRAYDYINNHPGESALKIALSLTASQYVKDTVPLNINKNIGDSILYNVKDNEVCSDTNVDGCIRTHLIQNDDSSDNLVLLPDISSTTYNSSNYAGIDTTLGTNTTGWGVTTRALELSDVMNLISTDINNSMLVRPNISNSIIGSVKYNDRLNTEVLKAVNYDELGHFEGYYIYSNSSFPYLVSSSCYWMKGDVNASKAFTFERIDDSNSRVYGEAKTSSCSVVPVIVIPKTKM